jgi:hypothetical protein
MALEVKMSQALCWGQVQVVQYDQCSLVQCSVGIKLMAQKVAGLMAFLIAPFYFRYGGVEQPPQTCRQDTN